MLNDVFLRRSKYKIEIHFAKADYCTLANFQLFRVQIENKKLFITSQVCLTTVSYRVTFNYHFSLHATRLSVRLYFAGPEMIRANLPLPLYYEDITKSDHQRQKEQLWDRR